MYKVCYMANLGIQVLKPPVLVRGERLAGWDFNPAFVLNMDFRWCVIIFFTDIKNTNHFVFLKLLFSGFFKNRILDRVIWRIADLSNSLISAFKPKTELYHLQRWSV